MFGRTVGHYRVLELLGGGGMGVVYKAEDLILGRVVALKFLPPELTRDDDARKRFLREARAASGLDHANICTVYEIGEDDGQAWIAMACYEGETLKAKVERGPLGVREAVGLAAQVARGLGRAHAAGIVHRDVKPANVIVTHEGVAKIVDFGLAKLAGATHITQSNAMLGTLVYMAPEQLRGEAVGAPADLWALGVVLFELVTGERPFRGDYAQAVSYAILNEQPRSLGGLRPDAPPELERIVKKLLRKDPLQRYQTAEELLAELEVVMTSRSGPGRVGARVDEEREELRAGARLGPYEIVEPLGSGGMGDVYRARDTRLERQVAVKVLAPEFSEDAERKQRFHREARTISSLSHANICTLFDVGEQEGTDYLVMELLEGETLAERIRRGALPMGELLKIGIQISEALGKAHQQGVVHRDLKPANVILTTGGVVKLVDFGLAKGIASVLGEESNGRRRREKPVSGDDPTEGREAPPSPAKPLTAEGAIVGTLPYMSPEQVEGKEADARSDIFALGAILYEMATGRRAFEGETKAKLVAAIIDREPTLLAGERAGNGSASSSSRSLLRIEHVVRQCLTKDPDRRWQSALDVANELRWVMERGGEPVTSDQPALEAVSRSVRGWRLAALLFAATSLALALVLTVRYDRMPSGKAPDNQRPSPKLQQLTWEPGLEHSPRIFPDGTSFVYVKENGGDSDIFLRRVGGEVEVNLTADCPEADGNPAVSPDGQWIAFRSNRDGGGIFIMGATGESVRRLTDFGRAPAWSHDGKLIAFHVLDPERRGIWVVNVVSGDTRRVFAGPASYPSWSPSGSRVAMHMSSEGMVPRCSVSTIPAGGGEPVTVVEFPTSLATLPIWTGNGIYYQAMTHSAANIWRVEVDETTGSTQSPPQLVIAGPMVYWPSPTPDGRRILFNQLAWLNTYDRFDFDGVSGRSRGTSTTFFETTRDVQGAWISPDGRWIATVLFERSIQDILLIESSTGATRRLTSDALREDSFVWAPDGSKLYFAVAPKDRTEIWSINPDGGGRELVVPASDPSTEPTYPIGVTPDSRALIVTTGPGSRVQRIDLDLPVEERHPEPLPTLPDGRWLGFDLACSNTVSPDGRWQLGFARGDNDKTDTTWYAFDFETKTYTPIADAGAATLLGWLPDSRRFLVARDRELLLMDRETGTVNPAGFVKEGTAWPALSPDGRTLVTPGDTNQGDIWMVEFSNGDVAEDGRLGKP